MAIFFPNLDATLQRKSGFDIYGQPVWGPAVPIRIAVIRFAFSAQKTSVRADSSASHGRSEEDVANTIVLTRPEVTVAHGDRMVVEGIAHEVVGFFPRRDLQGVLRHHEVTLRLAQPEST